MGWGHYRDGVREGQGTFGGPNCLTLKVTGKRSLKFLHKSANNKDKISIPPYALEERREKNHMSDISAMAASALAMNQSNMQQQIEMSLLRKSAEADREVSDMILENARRIGELSQRTAAGIDLYA